MAKEGRLFVLLAFGVDGFYFPDTLVHLSDQATAAADLVSTEIPVASQAALEEHFNELAATPTFTKHMHVFRGTHAMRDMTALLAQEFGMTLSSDVVFACAQDPNCLEVWTTANALFGKTIRIVDVLGSWNMTETGVGNVCHVNKGKNHALCHIESDVYKTGVAWMALGKPVDAPDQTPLPVAVRCHDMGLSKQDMQKHSMLSSACHLLSGNEFMAARADAILETTGEASGLTEVEDKPRIHVDPLHYGPPKPIFYQTISPSSNTNLCLDVPGGEADNGVQLWLWECNGADSQKFFVGGTKRLQYSPNGIGFGSKTSCIDAGDMSDMSNGKQLILWDCIPNVPQQQFMFAQETVACQWDNTDSCFGGTSSIPVDDTNMCLDYYADWDSPGQPLHVWECSGDSNQEWYFSDKTCYEHCESLSANREEPKRDKIPVEGLVV